jgi:hypothetical protein
MYFTSQRTLRPSALLLIVIQSPTALILLLPMILGLEAPVLLLLTNQIAAFFSPAFSICCNQLRSPRAFCGGARNTM